MIEMDMNDDDDNYGVEFIDDYDERVRKCNAFIRLLELYGVNVSTRETKQHIIKYVYIEKIRKEIKISADNMLLENSPLVALYGVISSNEYEKLIDVLTSSSRKSVSIMEFICNLYKRLIDMESEMRALKKEIAKTNKKYSTDKIIQLRSEGLSQREIAKQIGCDKGTVRNRLKSAGME